MIQCLFAFSAALCVPSNSPAAPSTWPAGEVIASVRTAALQSEPAEASSRYDWGACVMHEPGRYRMWWTRLGGANQRRFPYRTTLADGTTFEFTYPDRGDRLYTADSRDGLTWHLDGPDFDGDMADFGPDSPGPLMVLAPAENDSERMHIACPSVIRVDGTYYMYYEAACEFTCDRRPDGQVVVGNEYHNQVFVASSVDGRTWRKHPEDRNPQPIVPAPPANVRGRRRYGFGQPTACYRDGTFILHYVDSCTGPGDFLVRLEADNPLFQNARVFRRNLVEAGAVAAPAGAVARFAQTDIRLLGGGFGLTRPAYGTGRVNLLFSADGLFREDARATSPAEVFPQVRLDDPRGSDYQERLYPRFLTDAHGRILVQEGRITLFYGSGRGFKEGAFTWDIQRAEVPVPGKWLSGVSLPACR